MAVAPRSRCSARSAKVAARRHLSSRPVGWLQSVLVGAAMFALAGNVGVFAPTGEVLCAQEGTRRARAIELVTLGLRFEQAGDRVSARAYLRDAVSADPSYAEAYGALGELELVRGRFRDAEASFRVGMVRARPTVQLWVGLARALEGLGADDEAELELARAQAQLGEDATLLAFRADHAERHGRWSLALALTRRLAALALQDGDSERATQLHARARALSLLVGPLDPLSRGGSPLRRVLRAQRDQPPR